MQVVTDPAKGTTALIFNSREDLKSVADALGNLVIAADVQGKDAYPVIFIQSPLGLFHELAEDETREALWRSTFGDVPQKKTVLMVMPEVIGDEKSEDHTTVVDALKAGIKRLFGLSRKKG